MWLALWKKLTIDKPAALGDWLWDVFVVQLAAFLDRLTLRQVIACIPAVVLVLAYYHRIPIPPELMLVGDLLAYIDVFSVLFLFSVLARVTTVLFVLKQAVAGAAELFSRSFRVMRRMDFRHRREGGAMPRKRSTKRTKNDEPTYLNGLAWA